MINYTERITQLMRDVVARTPRLSFIDVREILVFGRFGRTDAEVAFATCQCLTLPESEPGYFFWRDRQTGELTRRSEWFVTKSPEVSMGRTKIEYLVSFALPRFCNQRLDRGPRALTLVGARFLFFVKDDLAPSYSSNPAIVSASSSFRTGPATFPSRSMTTIVGHSTTP